MTMTIQPMPFKPIYKRTASIPNEKFTEYATM